MHLNNQTTGQLERLQLLGCPVVIQDGKPRAPVIGLAVAGFNAIIHSLRVRILRNTWNSARRIDRMIEHGNRISGKIEAPHEYYACTYRYARFKATEALPSRWFNRA